jgi:hypothetical protein
MKKTMAVIAGSIAGGYIGFFLGFVALSVDAAWKGGLQTGYEAELGIFVGIFGACIAGALGGVAGTGRFGEVLWVAGFQGFLCVVLQGLPSGLVPQASPDNGFRTYRTNGGKVWYI